MANILKEARKIFTGASSSSSLTTSATDALGIPRELYSNVTDVGNVTVGEDTLMSYTLPANTLKTNKDFVEVEGAINTSISAFATRTIKLYFGATSMVIYILLPTDDYYLRFVARVYRVSNTVQRTTVTVYSNDLATTIHDTTVENGEIFETLSNSNIIKFTGESDTTNDIVQKTMSVIYYPAI